VIIIRAMVIFLIIVEVMVKEIIEAPEVERVMVEVMIEVPEM